MQVERVDLAGIREDITATLIARNQETSSFYISAQDSKNSIADLWNSENPVRTFFAVVTLESSSLLDRQITKANIVSQR